MQNTRNNGNCTKASHTYIVQKQWFFFKCNSNQIKKRDYTENEDKDDSKYQEQCKWQNSLATSLKYWKKKYQSRFQ